ncbi:hypothetical protein A9P82_01820 [Arachidicoccus ginsenosidimutans]|uniref:TonB-dependent receptor n=1 Tax=Arachidicoccus sp. BS20 TaxID=1850526 RepID=UPI0007F0D73C|nr:TonB-dependent receptor [Arachidicoccus sp. BS20]ANI88158.1 hypothetical protein A9P82_01820 [Arachidicoccus sp. BS20]
MKKISLIIIFIVSSTMSFSQTIIKGWVKDSKMKPIRNAGIAIKNGYDGTITDSAGNFSFTTTDKGIDTIQITFTGYEPFEKVVNIGNETININAVLKESFNELNAVTVSAGSFSAGDNKKGVVMTSLDILTTATNGDISTAMRTLPGVQQVGEQEGLFVHGGTAGETAQYMDGAVISNPYFRGAPQIMQRGRFDPNLFSGTMFATGGYSALYGDALSSVLLMNSNDFPEKTQYEIDASPLVYLVAQTQQLSKDKTSAWGVNYNFVNVKPYLDVVHSEYEIYDVPRYQTGHFYYHKKTKHGGMFKFYTAFGYNASGMRKPDVDSLYLKDQYNVKNTNWYNNFNYTQNLGNSWKMIWANSFTINADKINVSIVDKNNMPKAFDSSVYWMNIKKVALHQPTDNLQSRLVFEKKFSHLDAVRFGGEYDYTNSRLTYNNYPLNFKDNYGALFAETDVYFTHDFMMKLGARGELSSLMNQSKVAPRASLAYRVGDNGQVSAAYGIFYQKPDGVYLMYNPDLKFTQATHYILNYQRSTINQLFRVEAYYKKYDDLIKTIALPDANFTYNNNGNGYAKGVDLFWKDQKTIKGFEYWISYSYIDSKRNFLNYYQSIQPDFITPHTLSVVAKSFVLPIKTEFNLTYTFSTGRPYYYFAPQQNGTYNLEHQGKTQTLNDVGFSVDYLPTFGKKNAKTNIIIVGTVKNLFDFKQIYSYNYSYDGSYRQAVLPATRQQFFLGIFFTFGVDRSQQIINDNL